MALIVQKYGGTSVADLDRIRNVANRVVAAYNQGNNVVVILSAMAGITDSLIDMAQQVTHNPEKRELDVLLATGEQTTAALLAMTLNSMNYCAQSLLGFQAEVVTDCTFGNARIMDIGASRIKELIEKRCIVVVAGFQGVTAMGILPPLAVVAQIHRLWPLLLPFMQICVRFLPMSAVSIQRIPISAAVLVKLTGYHMRKCWKWPAWAQKYCRYVPSSLPKNTMCLFM